ncbi:unnamed protein product [Camellia sinensis]
MYVTINGNPDPPKNLFYYFAVFERNPSNDPVVLWLSGGPGCPSFDGFTYEHGQIFVVANAAKAVSMENIMKKYRYLSSSQEGAASVYTLADGSVGDWFGGFLYSAGQQANEVVQDPLSALSFTSLAVIFGAGLVTSLSPCTLSVVSFWLREKQKRGHWELGCIFIGIGYYAGHPWYISIICWKGVWTDRAGTTCGCFWFGRNYGSKPPRVIIELQLPSFFNNFDPRAAAANFPSDVQAYLAGLTFALVASPCSTPVLATLLGYIAASKILLRE